MLIVQEAALDLGLSSVAVFPVLIAALQGLVGFLLTSIILRQEAARLKVEYRNGNLEPTDVVDPETAADPEATPIESRLPAAVQTTAGTLFVVGVVVLIATLINNITDGILNTLVVALILGVTLRTLGVLKPSVLSGIDALGLMMIAILILVFVFGIAGIAGIAGFAALAGKLLGYTVPMSIAIGLTSLFGFPGTLILSQEAAKGAGESPEEVAAIEGEILPKMIVAGFSTVTITSVIVTSIIAGRIGG